MHKKGLKHLNILKKESGSLSGSTPKNSEPVYTYLNPDSLSYFGFTMGSLSKKEIHQ